MIIIIIVGTEANILTIIKKVSQNQIKKTKKLISNSIADPTERKKSPIIGPAALRDKKLFGNTSECISLII